MSDLDVGGHQLLGQVAGLLGLSLLLPEHLDQTERADALGERRVRLTGQFRPTSADSAGGRDVGARDERHRNDRGHGDRSHDRGDEEERPRVDENQEDDRDQAQELDESGAGGVNLPSEEGDEIALAASCDEREIGVRERIERFDPKPGHGAVLDEGRVPGVQIEGDLAQEDRDERDDQQGGQVQRYPEPPARADERAPEPALRLLDDLRTVLGILQHRQQQPDAEALERGVRDGQGHEDRDLSATHPQHPEHAADRVELRVLGEPIEDLAQHGLPVSWLRLTSPRQE
jgi:hypothetical protein